MNGAILGMTKQEISRKLDEIIDFSGCERYIDTPVKRYSSGMMVRLGFAVAAHLDPEILVVDEVLAVGDAEFQKKAIGKMQSVSQGDGRTVLFVSHNMGSVRQLCKSGVLLENGMVAKTGKVQEIVDYYLTNSNFLRTTTHVDIDDSMRDLNRSRAAILTMAEFVSDSAIFASDEDIVIRVGVKAFRHFDQLRVNIGVLDNQDVQIGAYSSESYFSIEKGEEKNIEYVIHKTNLAMGTYALSFSVGMGNAKEGETNLEVVHHALSFDIDRISREKNLFFAKWDKSWGTFIFDATMREL